MYSQELNLTMVTEYGKVVFMEVTQRVTPVSMRVVVTTADNSIFVAQLTDRQLEEINERYHLSYKRPRGPRPYHYIESAEKENSDASTQTESSTDSSQQASRKAS
jgi:hypothetical protein